MPPRPEAQHEADMFRRLRGSEPTQWIFSPGDPKDVIRYGPNYACDGVQWKRILMAPSTAVASH
jgi:hypothetical protein